MLARLPPTPFPRQPLPCTTDLWSQAQSWDSFKPKMSHCILANAHTHTPHSFLDILSVLTTITTVLNSEKSYVNYGSTLPNQIRVSSNKWFCFNKLFTIRDRGEQNCSAIDPLLLKPTSISDYKSNYSAVQSHSFEKSAFYSVSIKTDSHKSVLSAWTVTAIQAPGPIIEQVSSENI